MANSVLKIKPSDDIWNDDFLSQHIGKRVVLRCRDGEIIDDYLHENGAGSLIVGDWCVGQGGDPFSFFEYLEIDGDSFTMSYTSTETCLKESDLATARAMLEGNNLHNNLKMVDEVVELPSEIEGIDKSLRERYLMIGNEIYKQSKKEDGGYCIKQIIADEAAEYFKTQSDLNNLSIKEKIMNVIKNAFKSKEDRALEYYNFGRVDNLNDIGLEEFLSFLWETADKDTKKAFLKLIVDRYKEDNRCK
jgi:hypothetical protein